MNGKRKPHVNEDTCMGCQVCMDACYTLEKKNCLILKNGVMCIINEEECLSYQPDCEYRCVRLCPTKSFTLSPI